LALDAQPPSITLATFLNRLSDIPEFGDDENQTQLDPFWNITLMSLRFAVDFKRNAPQPDELVKKLAREVHDVKTAQDLRKNELQQWKSKLAPLPLNYTLTDIEGTLFEAKWRGWTVKGSHYYRPSRRPLTELIFNKHSDESRIRKLDITWDLIDITRKDLDSGKEHTSLGLFSGWNSKLGSLRRITEVLQNCYGSCVACHPLSLFVHGTLPRRINIQKLSSLAKEHNWSVKRYAREDDVFIVVKDENSRRGRSNVTVYSSGWFLAVIEVDPSRPGWAQSLPILANQELREVLKGSYDHRWNLEDFDVGKLFFAQLSVPKTTVDGVLKALSSQGRWAVHSVSDHSPLPLGLDLYLGVDDGASRPDTLIYVNGRSDPILKKTPQVDVAYSKLKLKLAERFGRDSVRELSRSWGVSGLMKVPVDLDLLLETLADWTVGEEKLDDKMRRDTFWLSHRSLPAKAKIFPGPGPHLVTDFCFHFAVASLEENAALEASRNLLAEIFTCLEIQASHQEHMSHMKSTMTLLSSKLHPTRSMYMWLKGDELILEITNVRDGDTLISRLTTEVQASPPPMLMFSKKLFEAPGAGPFEDVLRVVRKTDFSFVEEGLARLSKMPPMIRFNVETLESPD
jgi:hypothetical protein